MEFIFEKKASTLCHSNERCCIVLTEALPNSFRKLHVKLL